MISTKNTLAYIFLLVAISASSVCVFAAASKCGKQNQCIQFTSKLMDYNTNCSKSGCSFEICAATVFDSPSCYKSSTDSIEYTCPKDTGTIYSNSAARNVLLWKGTTTSSDLLPLSSIVNGVKNGFTQCQIVTGGTSVQFIFYDGNSCNDVAYHYNDTTKLSATCSGRSKDTISCTGNKRKRECVWTVVAPTCDGIYCTSEIFSGGNTKRDESNGETTENNNSNKFDDSYSIKTPGLRKTTTEQVISKKVTKLPVQVPTSKPTMACYDCFKVGYLPGNYF